MRTSRFSSASCIRVCARVAFNTVLLALCCSPLAAQTQLPYLNAGPDSPFAEFDLAELYSNDQILEWVNKNRAPTTVDSDSVSMLDMLAPDKAVEQFKHAISLLKQHRSKDAMALLQKSIATYPKFVSAHNALGLVYLDQRDPRAKTEFETAGQLDNQFAPSFVNLGLAALVFNDFPSADANLQKAASLAPDDVRVLVALAFAQHGNHKDVDALRTAGRVHELGDRGLASAHYIAAAAALTLGDTSTTERELSTFLAEDPSNPLSPVARQRLEALTTRDSRPPTQAPAPETPRRSSIYEVNIQTFPNSDHLHAQLLGMNTSVDETESEACSSCAMPEPSLATDASPTLAVNRPPLLVTRNGLFTLRQPVDETTLFFSVSHHGRTVSDLSLSDIQILDDDKPPAKIFEFLPQSQLPLRIGLLIDTSESVTHRLAFEKNAARRFLARTLTGDDDLAFVAGFNRQISVVQDFANDRAQLARGIDQLSTDGDTALFDAVSYACWKLAAYPDTSRVARVLVVLTDGEDNASSHTLRQAVDAAEASGVTIYAISTAEVKAIETDANNVLQTLAEFSGGKFMFPGDLNALDRVLGRLPDVIRSRYLVAYKAAEFADDGRYRKLHVTASKNGKRLKVHVRPGYYARVDTTSE